MIVFYSHYAWEHLLQCSSLFFFKSVVFLLVLVKVCDAEMLRIVLWLLIKVFLLLSQGFDTQTCRMNALNAMQVFWDESICVLHECKVHWYNGVWSVSSGLEYLTALYSTLGSRPPCFIFNHAPFKPINNAGWYIKG